MLSQYLLLFLLTPQILSHSLVKRQDDEEGTGGKFPAIREVKPNIFSFTSNGFIISLIMVTSEGVMVIDPMDVTHSEAMLAEIRNSVVTNYSNYLNSRDCIVVFGVHIHRLLTSEL